MANEVSIFIMDISNSSKENIGNELSEYLEQLKTTLPNGQRIQLSQRSATALVMNWWL